MPEPATQSDTQSDTLSDTQPMISEPLLVQEPPAEARWRVSRSALLLIGGPLAGALLVWLAISIFRSNPSTPPAAITEQVAPEPIATEPAPEPVEAQPAIEAEANVANPPEAEPAPVAPAPADPEPRQQPDVPLSAINEILPKVSQSALDTISGTVRVSVRVTINTQGAVVDATSENPGPSRYFERLSIEASRKWTFTPANSEEQRTMLLKFNFKREGVTAEAHPDEG
jgi:TonB family protein